MSIQAVDLSISFPALDKLLGLVDDIVLLKTSDGRRFVLAEVDDFDQEITLAGQNQALVEFLAQRSREVSTYSLGQVRKRLNLS